MKRTTRAHRLAALVLALLLLAGCAAPEENQAAGDNTSAETGEPADSGNTPSSNDTSTEDNRSGFFPSRVTGDSDRAQEEPSISPEEENLTRRMGALAGDLVEISAAEAEAINRSMADMRLASAASSNGEDPLVRQRDWDRYASPLGQEQLYHREAEFFDRLDKLCREYISTSGLDAVRNLGSGNEQNRYRPGGVRYGDLGLTAQQAQNILTWFTYNYPQYYFLNSWAAWDMSSGMLYPCVYEFAADGEERAEITNELFDKLDGWIQDVESSAETTYQKELYANDLICEAVTYNHDALEDDSGPAIWICQSLYSVVILEDTVCAGYSKAFTAMMNALDVEATAALSVNHAWNVVRLEDGNCYAVDVCWNDTDRNPPYKHDYLNIGEAIMSETNSRKEAHTYKEPMARWIPAIARESYAPTEADLQQPGSSAGGGTGSPAAPTNVRAAAAGEKKVTITWDPVPGAEVYDSCAYTDSTYSEIIEDCLYTLDAEDGAADYWTGLREGATYYFGIRAGKTVGGETVYSDWTNFSYTHTWDAAPQGPAAPANFKAASVEEADGVLLTWDPVPGATVYDSCVYTDSTCTEIMGGALYTNLAEDGESFGWTGLTLGATYYFGVRAGTDVNSETVYSDWVNLSYTPSEDAAPRRPAAPANIQTAAAGEDEVSITWDPVPGAEVYDSCAYADSAYSEIAEGCLYTLDAEDGAADYWTGLKEGYTYYFGVRAGKTVDGEMVYSDWTNFSYTHGSAS